MAEQINIDIDLDFAVKRAAELFELGEIFAYPSDTIYGFGGNPFYQATQEKINIIKGRGEEKKFIYLINSVERLSHFAQFEFERKKYFLKKIWPDKVSVILNLKDKLANEFNSADAAFRIPDTKFCKALLEKIKLPLISTSINRSGEDPLVDYEDIDKNFGSEISTVFYSAEKPFLRASTLIDLTGEKPKLLREGEVDFNHIEKVFDETEA